LFAVGWQYAANIKSKMNVNKGDKNCSYQPRKIISDLAKEMLDVAVNFK